MKGSILVLPINRVHKKSNNAEKNYVCDICGYRTDEKQNLSKHTKAVHNKQKCPYCDYRAVSKNYVEVHIDRMHQVEHGGDLNHICSHCGKGFLFKFSLTAHVYRYPWAYVHQYLILTLESRDSCLRKHNAILLLLRQNI